MSSVRFLLIFLALAGALGASARAQEAAAGVDLLYPEFRYPHEDAVRAIKHRDFRFITLDRIGQDVPGLERYPQFKSDYGLKLLKQHINAFASASEKFTFDLRARAYARDYNNTILDYIAGRRRPKSD